MDNSALTKARIRAAELHFDGLTDEEIAKQLADEGFKPRGRRTINGWLSTPQCQELLSRLEKVAADKCVKRRRKLQEVALTKAAMFLDGVGNTVTINGKTKTQEVKPEVTAQLIKALLVPQTQKVEMEHSGKIEIGDLEAARAARIAREAELAALLAARTADE